MRDLADKLEEAREASRAVQDIEKGDCFRQAAKYAIKHDVRLVHGTVNHPVTGKTFQHAWVEDGSKVIDPTTGVGVKTKPIDRKGFYELLGIDYRLNQVYDPPKAVGLMVTTRHWGPWTKSEWEKVHGKGWKPLWSARP